jgi:hypothetical protein
MDEMFSFLRRPRKVRASPPAVSAASIAFTIVVWDASSGRYLTVTPHP